MKTINILIICSAVVVLGFTLTRNQGQTAVIDSYHASTLPEFVPTPLLIPTPGTYGTKIEGKVFEDSFMENCLGPDTTLSYCRCGYKFLQDHYTMEELEKSEKMTEKEMTTWLMPLAVACSDFLKSSTSL